MDASSHVPVFPGLLGSVQTVVWHRISLWLSGEGYTRGGRPPHQARANLCNSDRAVEGTQVVDSPLSTVVAERERPFHHVAPSLGRCLDSESQINGAEPERRAGPAIQVLLMENSPLYKDSPASEPTAVAVGAHWPFGKRLTLGTRVPVLAPHK